MSSKPSQITVPWNVSDVERDEHLDLGLEPSLRTQRGTHSDLLKKPRVTKAGFSERLMLHNELIRLSYQVLDRLVCIAGVILGASLGLGEPAFQRIIECLKMPPRSWVIAIFLQLTIEVHKFEAAIARFLDTRFPLGMTHDGHPGLPPAIEINLIMKNVRNGSAS
jgi:hypothetical protein